MHPDNTTSTLRPSPADGLIPAVSVDLALASLEWLRAQATRRKLTHWLPHLDTIEVALRQMECELPQAWAEALTPLPSTLLLAATTERQERRRA